MKRKKEIKLKGIGVYPSITVGSVKTIFSGLFEIPKVNVLKSYVTDEIKRFQKALESSKNQISSTLKKVDPKEQKEIYSILEIQEMFLNDSSIVSKIENIIVDKQINAEWAIEEVLEEMKTFFSNINDPYLKERQEDLSFVAQRLMKSLQGHDDKKMVENIEGKIIVTSDLSPLEVVRLHRKKVLGIITESGGLTSHTSITLRTLGIPSVVGVEGVLSKVENGDSVILDGRKGNIWINPTSDREERFLKRQKRLESKLKELQQYISQPSVTIDGEKLHLFANVDLVEELPIVKSFNVEGIGLFRTEFLFLNRESFPEEEEQFLIYKRILEEMETKSVTIRTLDLGADKQTPLISHEEENPALGLRGVRLTLYLKNIFKVQIRALLRAGVYGNLKIMIPMVSGLREVIKVKEIINEVKKELTKENAEFKSDIPLGVMIETPSAALTSDIIAKEVDFFSVGTNDLIQYSLAIDRRNEHVSYLYEPLHPAILRFLKIIAENAKKADIPVGICGEMASDPNMTLILLALGYDNLSMIPFSTLKVKRVLRNSTKEDALALSRKVLNCKYASSIDKLVKKYMENKFPGDIEEE